MFPQDRGLLIWRCLCKRVSIRGPFLSPDEQEVWKPLHTACLPLGIISFPQNRRYIMGLFSWLKNLMDPMNPANPHHWHQVYQPHPVHRPHSMHRNLMDPVNPMNPNSMLNPMNPMNPMSLHNRRHHQHQVHQPHPVHRPHSMQFNPSSGSVSPGSSSGDIQVTIPAGICPFTLTFTGSDGFTVNDEHSSC